MNKLLAGWISLAIPFFLPAQNATAVSIPTVVVDHPGYGEDGDAQFAEVNYTYRIGQYEVTCAEYAAFLNAVATDADPHGLHHPEMETAGIRRIENDCGSDWGTVDCPKYTYSVLEGWEQKPVTWVSFWDAARFANWLTHDQPVGPCGPETTEDGMYPLIDGESRAIPVVRSREAWNSGGVALASVDEWFKAAEYDPGKSGNGGLWSYPTMSDEEPIATAPNDTLPNSANFKSAVGRVTEVGGYALARSFFGTFDQMGNVEEWLESPVDGQIEPGVWVWQRIAAGGGFASESYHHQELLSESEGPTMGFRIVSREPVGPANIRTELALRKGEGDWAAMESGFVEFTEATADAQVRIQSLDSLDVHAGGDLSIGELPFGGAFLVSLETSTDLERWWWTTPGEHTRGEKRFYRIFERGVFATIPGGTFQMGDSHGDGIENELPVHEVDVSSFMIQQAEVTNGQFASVMNWAIQNWPRSIEIYSDGSSLMYDSLHLVSLQSAFNELYILEREVQVDSGKEDYPCLSMTWYGAMVYCHILTQIAGDLTQAVDLSNWTIDLTATGFRPPTEAEWEKAARGGLVGMRFPWGDVIDHSYANYAAWGTQYTYDQSPYEVMRYHPDWDGGELPYTNPAGAFPPNGFGLYDLAGNGAEWCYDYYSADTYATSGSLNPTGPASGSRRILRGGTFWAPAPACRVSYRMSLDPTEVGGFRPARSLEAASP